MARGTRVIKAHERRGDACRWAERTLETHHPHPLHLSRNQTASGLRSANGVNLLACDRSRRAVSISA